MTETKNLKLKTYETTTDGQELVARYIDNTSDNFQKIDEFCKTDTTLSVEGGIADAKTVGDNVSQLKKDLNAIQTGTSEDVGKALKAKTVTDGKVTEWEFGEAGGGSNFVNNVKRNMINKNTLTEGTLSTVDGSIMTNGLNANRWISDFVPVTNKQIIRTIKIHNVVAYDVNKQFVRTKINQYTSGGAAEFITKADEAYLRFDFYKSWHDDAFASLAKYYDTSDIDGTVYVGIDSSGRQIITTSLADYANDNPLLFYKTQNLFDYINDEYYIKSKLTADGEYKYTIYDSDIPDSANAYITPTNYYPVTEGQTLFCNYYCWASAYYDKNKQYLGAIPARPAFSGWTAPKGCAFVRISIKGSNATPTPSDCIGNLNEMHKVILYALDTEQNIAPKPMDGLLPYQIDGKMIAPNYLDTVIPNMIQSEFLSAMRCMAIREANGRDHAYRFGNFNMLVTAQRKGWYMARKMFMDYGLDFCGMEEVNTGADISKFMKSWQFPYGFDTNFTDGTDPIDKSLVSRFPVLTSQKLYTTSSGSSVTLLNSKIQLPRLYDVYNPKRVLSVYVVHLPITSNENKVSVANEILAFIANDTSDYIIILGDTNDFATTEEGKLYWRTFESGGFSPVIPITTKTITQDNLTITEGDESASWRKNSIDQFLISSNIEAVSYGVVNTKDEYGLDTIIGTATDNEPALSDHDFVWCDLKFLDAVRQ